MIVCYQVPKSFLIYSLFCLRSLIKVHERLLTNRLCFIPFCLIARNYYTLCTSVFSQVLVLSHWYIGLKNSPLLKGFSVPFLTFWDLCTSYGHSLTQGFIKDILAHGSVGFLLTDSTFLHPKRRLLARRLVLDFPFCFGYLGFWAM